MTLDGAINLNETNDYIIYTMNSVTTGQYGVVVPKVVNGTLNMLVDLHMKGSFDGVSNGSKTKEQLVAEISEEYSKLKTKYVDGMLVMPMIDETLFQSTVLNGDKQKMFDEVKKIGAITSELYKKLTEQGIDKQKIDQKIILVEKTSEDERFVAWLKEQSNMSNFIDGLLYSELNATQQVVNPFVDSNNIFGTAQAVEPVASAPVNVGGMFDNVAPAATVTPAVEPVVPVAPATPVEPAMVASADPVTPVAESVVNPAPSAPVDLFGNSATQPVQNTVAQAAPVSPAPAPVVEGPKPVDAAMLEGTIAFTPIPNHPNNATETTTEDSAPTGKGSKGFVNLAILLVVLVGITLVSIELGKYLYNVYGA